MKFDPENPQIYAQLRQREIEYRRHRKQNLLTPLPTNDKAHQVFKDGKLVFSSDLRKEAMQFIFETAKMSYLEAMSNGYGYKANGKVVHGDCGPS